MATFESLLTPVVGYLNVDVRLLDANLVCFKITRLNFPHKGIELISKAFVLCLRRKAKPAFLLPVLSDQLALNVKVES